MGRNNKRRKNYYIQSAKRQKQRHNFLEPGLRGFLCTCNSHEKDCVKEVYNLLNQFGDKLYGPEQQSAKSQQEEAASKDHVNEQEEKANDDNGTAAAAAVAANRDKGREGSDEDDDDMDIDAALKADLEEIQTQGSGQKEEKKRYMRRFQQVKSGASNCIFIKTTLPDPLPISLAIMDHIIDNKEQCTKRLHRLIPVQGTCKAFQEDIQKAVRHLAEEFFKNKGKSYYIAFKTRNNSSMKRETLLPALIKILQEVNPKNTPNMLNPEVVLNIEVIKNHCCFSLLPEYFSKYSKYNVVSIVTKSKEEQSKEKKGQEKIVESKSDHVKAKQLQLKDQTGPNIAEKQIKNEAGSVKEEAGVAKKEDLEVTRKEEEAGLAKKEEEVVAKKDDEAGVAKKEEEVEVAKKEEVEVAKKEEEAGVAMEKHEIRVSEKKDEATD